MKLIDGDVLVAIFANCPEGDFSSAEVARTIDNAPTIDAVPVVHAYWRFRKVREGNHQYICSNCNDSFGFRGDEYDLPKQSFVRKDYRFCRNCGARMDAEKEEPT